MLYFTAMYEEAQDRGLSGEGGITGELPDIMCWKIDIKNL